MNERSGARSERWISEAFDGGNFDLEHENFKDEIN